MLHATRLLTCTPSPSIAAQIVPAQRASRRVCVVCYGHSQGGSELVDECLLAGVSGEGGHLAQAQEQLGEAHGGLCVCVCVRARAHVRV